MLYESGSAMVLFLSLRNGWDLFIFGDESICPNAITIDLESDKSNMKTTVSKERDDKTRACSQSGQVGLLSKNKRTATHAALRTHPKGALFTMPHTQQVRAWCGTVEQVSERNEGRSLKSCVPSYRVVGREAAPACGRKKKKAARVASPVPVHDSYADRARRRADPPMRTCAVGPYTRRQSGQTSYASPLGDPPL